MTEILTDAEREQAIVECMRRMEIARDPQLKRSWFKQMAELIADRSPAQVERMEIAKGLRK
jgi:hypothetical protein